MEKQRLRKISILSLCLVISCIAKAQENTLALRLGPGSYARQDLTFSPFVHTSWSMVNAGLDYYHKGKNIQFATAQVGIYKASITDTYTFDEDKQTSPHVFTLVNLWYGYGKSVINKNENNSLAVGASFEADIEPSSYNYAWTNNFG